MIVHAPHNRPSPSPPLQGGTETPALVVVVVLTWNGREDTLECLRSLERSTWNPCEVVVVDNASTDGTVEAVKSRFPRAHLLRSEVNRGFSGGNNLGIRYARETLNGAYVMLLNNDTLIAPDAIEKLVDAARGEDVGAACPLIYFVDPPDLVWYGGASFEPRRGRSGRMYGYRRPRSLTQADTADVDRAVGAAMLFRSASVESVGLLDEDFFFLYEDVEWSLRLRQHGLRVVFVPGAAVWHKVAASQGGSEYSPTTAYYGTRNHLEVCRRYAPLPGGRACVRALVAVGVHLAEVRFAQNKLAWMRGVWDGFRDYRRGRLGPRRLSHRSPRAGSS